MLSLHKNKKRILSASIALAVIVPAISFAINKISVSLQTFADTVYTLTANAKDTLGANLGTYSKEYADGSAAHVNERMLDVDSNYYTFSHWALGSYDGTPIYGGVDNIDCGDNTACLTTSSGETFQTREIHDNITVYAVYEGRTFTLTSYAVDTDGNALGTLTNEQYAGHHAEVLPRMFNLDDTYTFSHWALGSYDGTPISGYVLNIACGDNTVCQTSTSGNTFMTQEIFDDITVYAIFDKEEEEVSDYTVTFNANGGTGGDQTLTCAPNTSGSCIVNTANLPSVPTRDGYYLMGWAKTANATEPEYDVSDLVTVNSSTTIYAVWKQQVTIVLTLNTNGGSPERAPGQTCVTYEGGTCSWNVNMFTDTTYPVSRPGYTRLGWSSNQNATTPEYVLGDTVTFSSNLTLYMVWESNSSSEDTYTYTLSYNANGGTGAPSSTGTSATTATSHTFTVSSTVPTRDGYTFLGWASSSTATTAEYTSGDRITLYASGTTSKTLYAVWEEDEPEAEYTYTITFNANNGTGAPSALSYGPTTDTSHAFTLPTAEPTRSGYTFLGWATSATATTAGYQPNGTVTITSSNINPTLYAIWAPVYSLTYSLNGGLAQITPQSCSPATTNGTCPITIISTEPARDGYTFLGWANSSSAITADYVGGDTITMSASKTIYAVWEEDEPEIEYTYTITFNANNGTGAPSALSYGPTTDTSHAFTLPTAEPTRSGYTFLGWATSATATTATYQPGSTITVSSSNTARTLYAVWEEDEPEAEYTYTITFGEDTDEGVTNLPEDLTYGPTTDDTHTFTLPTDEPIKDGYTFKGWATTKDATEPEYNGGDPITINANDTSKTLYPVWEANDDGSDDDNNDDNADTGETDTDNTVTTPDTGKNTESNDGTSSILFAAPIAAIVLGAGLYTAQRKKSHRIYE